MKRCPSCNRTYTDASLNFCLEDGTPLVVDAPPPSDPNATMRYPSPRETSEPPPTEIYRPDSPIINPAPITTPPPPPTSHQPPPPQWSPTPTVAPQKKSNAIWWVLGGLAVFGVLGIGLVVIVFALASMSNTNTNNSNNRNVNRNSNVVTNTNTNINSNTNTNTNSNSSNSAFSDDFTEEKWGTGSSGFGRIWYADDEYHMTSKDKSTFIVMYAPSDDYSTENATVKVTGRSVDGTVPAAGFGLMVHCQLSKAKHLEDYALLIYPNVSGAEYEVIIHKDGVQSTLIPKTQSGAIRTGTNPNQLEIRMKGTEISFYVNGQYLNRITDTANYKRGRAGLYTSDTTEIAFDDLEINR